MKNKIDLKIIQDYILFKMTDLQNSIKKARKILFDDEIFTTEIIDPQENRRNNYRANQFKKRRQKLTTIGEEREREVKELLIEEHGEDYFCKEKTEEKATQTEEEYIRCKDIFRKNNKWINDNNYNIDDDDIRSCLK